MVGCGIDPRVAEQLVDTQRRVEQASTVFGVPRELKAIDQDGLKRHLADRALVDLCRHLLGAGYVEMTETGLDPTSDRRMTMLRLLVVRPSPTDVTDDDMLRFRLGGISSQAQRDVMRELAARGCSDETITDTLQRLIDEPEEDACKPSSM
jgi:hypothetical protein